MALHFAAKKTAAPVLAEAAEIWRQSRLVTEEAHVPCNKPVRAQLGRTGDIHSYRDDALEQSVHLSVGETD